MFLSEEVIRITKKILCPSNIKYIQKNQQAKENDNSRYSNKNGEYSFFQVIIFLFRLHLNEFN